MLTQEAVFEVLERLYKEYEDVQKMLDEAWKKVHYGNKDEQEIAWRETARLQILRHKMKREILDLEAVFDAIEPQGYIVIEI